ncbi:DUF4062 domain-containing protein [Mesorhizobium sp. M0522]|uniref:DUF4062 domain-containing protein n=1 Tax=Mesorhizobium sp. M0522 TaxID=2956958 RepID=UPI00333A0BE6
MDKRYQVFVSSTYSDLKSERQRVIQTLMEMDCIPAVMELFPAADEQQWEFIKKVIEDSDYYILILGGKYGSMTSEGISYTEKEFDYASSIGLRILPFIHESPQELPVSKSEVDADLRQKLGAFRDKAMRDRLVKFWSNEKELPGLVALSLPKTIKTYPAVGWVRADKIASDDLIQQIGKLQAKNIELSTTISNMPYRNEIKGIADLTEKFTVTLEWTEYNGSGKHERSAKYVFSWEDIFAAIAPDLMASPSDVAANSLIGAALYRKVHPTGTQSARVQHDCFQTIKVQFVALGFVNAKLLQTVSGGMSVFWSLTALGEQEMARTRTVKATRVLENSSNMPGLDNQKPAE